MTPPPSLLAACRARVARLIASARAGAAPDVRLVVASPSEWDPRVIRPVIANGALWPPNIALPLTVADAVAGVERDADRIAEELATEVARFIGALVAPELRGPVLDRCVNGWRTPTGERMRPAVLRWGFVQPMSVELRALLSAGAAPPGDAHAMSGENPAWPAEVAPREVATWAREALDRAEVQFWKGQPPAYQRGHDIQWNDEEKTERATYIGRGAPMSLGDRFVQNVEILGPAGVDLRDDKTGREERWPAVGMALVYLAERTARAALDTITPRPWPNVVPVDVGRPVVYTIASLSGANPPKSVRRGQTASLDTRATEDPAEPVEMVFRWHDGTEEDYGPSTQIELPLWADAPVALLAVQRRYGPAAVRDLLALGAQTWAARRPAGDAFWWWASEHLEVTGLSDNKDSRKRLSDWVSSMRRSTLTIRYRKGPTLTGPIVTVSAESGGAARLHLHPGLFRGVTQEDGKLGTSWWALPMDLLRLRANTVPVHALAVIAGNCFRATLSTGDPLLRIGLPLLVERLGITTRPEYSGDPRAVSTLRRTLEAAHEAGVLADGWQIDSGSLDRLSGVLVARPGPTALAIAGGARVERPAWIPATGEELEEWMATGGLTVRAAAELLNIPERTLRDARATFRNGRPLSINVREKLRAYLWPT